MKATLDPAGALTLPLGSAPLDAEHASRAAHALLARGCSPGLARDFLGALAARGPTAVEVAAFAQVLRSSARTPQDLLNDVSDVVGTGGDGSINVSTLAALTAAAGGRPVAKAGNRAATSRCGSADLLEQLGARLPQSVQEAHDDVARHGFGFVPTPVLHPGMAALAVVRRTLGVRTIFNLCGPLSNPLATGARLVGAADPKEHQVLAEAAALLGLTRTWVVRGDDGMDELSTQGPTRVLSVSGDGVTELTIDPTDLPVRPATRSDLRGGDPPYVARVATALLDGAGSTGLRDCVALNAAALLHLSDTRPPLAVAVDRARELLASGQVGQLLRRLTTTTSTTERSPVHAS